MMEPDGRLDEGGGHSVRRVNNSDASGASTSHFNETWDIPPVLFESLMGPVQSLDHAPESLLSPDYSTLHLSPPFSPDGIFCGNECSLLSVSDEFMEIDESVIESKAHPLQTDRNLFHSAGHGHDFESSLTVTDPLQDCEQVHADYDDNPSDYDDAVSVTSNLEYAFEDAHEYFTMEVDPVQAAAAEDSSYFVPDPHDPEPQTDGAYSHNIGSNSEDMPTADPPLYSGASVTVSECGIAFLSLMLGNDISGELLSRFISFIQLILPKDNKFFYSLHSFLKRFENLKTPMNFIFYCSVCLRNLPSKDSVCNRCSEMKVNYYLQLPVLEQIKSLYANPKFVEALSYRFTRVKKNEENLEDIYDGELYKSAHNILSEPYNTSLMWNMDGISPFKSSNFQISPLFFTFNELPPHLRYKEEYLILAGLAFGNEKPACNLFLKPIAEEMEILRNGVEVKIAHLPSPVPVKIIVLCGTCDAPAKSIVFRLNNFNGFYGCPRCLANGEKTHESSNVFVYPVNENIVPRTKEGYENDLRAVKASGKKEPVHGVKGPTYMFKMVWSFFLMSTAIDVMHNVYLGVCKQLFFIWFSSAFIKKVFGENAERKPLVETLSTILCHMQAPHYISHPPRSLLNVKYFKASEFRTWLFSTALPLLCNYMKEPYLGHFTKLVCAVSFLNKDSIPRQDVEEARSLLQSFVRDFQQLYGVRNMSFNVHCLLHLPDIVLLCGPLFVSSCFGYENLNGRLCRLVHGTRHVGMQMYSHLDLLRNLSPLIESVKVGPVREFCESMIFKSKQLKITAQIEKGVSIVGKISKEHVLPPEYDEILCSTASLSSNFSFFFRLKQYNFLYVAEDYGKGMRNSSCVQYTSQAGESKYGCIKVFVKLTSCKCKETCEHNGHCVALLQNFDWTLPFATQNPSVPISHILSIKPSNICCVPISSIKSVCFKVAVGNDIYLSVPLNPCELE